MVHLRRDVRLAVFPEALLDEVVRPILDAAEASRSAATGCTSATP
ncbi:hypothetical protein [Actinomadura sp. CNU-125]|nr:hypothetical protein [Actinomadura sp. CNU-125]